MYSLYSIRFDAVALNPQPLPPRFAGAFLNPQPLPPRFASPLLRQGIVIVGG